MTNLELKQRFSEHIHKVGGANWRTYFSEFKNTAQDLHKLSPIDYWIKTTYPDAFRQDGSLRKDCMKKMNLKEPKSKKTKKKPEPIPTEEEEVEDGK